MNDTLRLFVTVDAIYLLHNQGSPLHGGGNHLVGYAAEQLPEVIGQPIHYGAPVWLPDALICYDTPP
jgi:hypothetical protein